MIKYSFIIPVYNCIEYLTKCVDSILSAIALQNSNAEIVLIDDGSTDGSSMLCDQFLNRNKCIRIIHQKNHGVSCARNIGINESKGEYIVFVDADDEIIPEKLASLMDNIPDEMDMVVFGLEYQCYENMKYASITRLCPPIEGICDRKSWQDILLDLYNTNSLTSVWSRFIRREIIINNNIFFKEKMFLYEDLDFVLRTISCCDQIFFTKDIIYKYQLRKDFGKNQHRINRVKHISDVVDEIEDSLIRIKKDRETDQILLNLYVVLMSDKCKGKSKANVKRQYDEFIEWVDNHELLYLVQDNRSLLLTYNKSYYVLTIRNIYYSIRHYIAIRVKHKIGYIGNRL